MKPNFSSILFIGVSVVIGLILGLIIKEYYFLFSLETTIIIAIVVCGLVILSLTLHSLKGGFDSNQALGLPSGSVRAIIALGLLVMFVFISVLFYLTSDKQEQLAEKILTILGTLVVAVASFYFGAKATEQGSLIAEKAFKDSKDKSSVSEKVSPELILKTIAENKDKWIKEFDCIDIKLGKKETDGVSFNVYCIVFFVKDKSDKTPGTVRIPSIITLNHNGKSYSIPTDVKIPVASTATTTATLEDIETLISEKKDEFLELYKADALQAALKIAKGETLTVPCLQFIVRNKSTIPDNTLTIPPFIEYNGLKVITDVKVEETPTEDAGEICLGDAVCREDVTAKGTIGLKVYREEAGGAKKDYLLSCYHVFCHPELKNDVTIFSGSVNSKITAIKKDNSKVLLGEVSEGEFNSRIDAALCLLNAQASVSPALRDYFATPKNGIRIITTQDVLNKMEVFTYGAVTGEASGYVIAREAGRPIEIFGKTYQFENVIPVTKISVPGDSGALAVDKKGKVIGIIFASNPTNSFIIPIAEIIIHFKIKIYDGI